MTTPDMPATAHFNIEAAKEHQDMKLVRSLLAKANIQVSKQITVPEFDAMVASSNLSTLQKMQLKTAMSHAGILLEYPIRG
jgi:hypothetical protein